MNHIKVSVIMPSLNVEPYIRESVDSVIRQSLKELEIICVDSGSIDGTLEILRECAQEDSRIKLIKSGKKSYGAQVNIGLDMAVGEYVAIVETDDFIRQTMYEDLVSLAEQTQADYVKADYDTVMMIEDGSYYYERIRKLKDFPEYYNKVLSASDLLPIYLTESTLWRGIYKRSFLEKHHIRLHKSEGASYQDLAFVLQTMLKAQRAYYTDRSYYCYRIDRQEASTWNPDCFIKVAKEISWILDSGITAGASEAQSRAVKAVLLNSFMWSLGQTVFSGAADLNNGCFREAYEYFCCMVKKWSGGRNLWPDYFPDAQWEWICLALMDLERFIRQKDKERAERERQNGIWNRLKKQEYILFGCGKKGRRFFSEGRKKGLMPSALCDNNASLWGLKWEEISIMPAGECAVKYSDALYVVVNNHSEIREQLISLGIPEMQIVLY